MIRSIASASLDRTARVCLSPGPTGLAEYIRVVVMIREGIGSSAVVDQRA